MEKIGKIFLLRMRYAIILHHFPEKCKRKFWFFKIF
jgi:hypothetical protein